jgi:hypothetical protein
VLTLQKSLNKAGQSVQWKGEKEKASTWPIELRWEDGPFQ